MTGCAAIRSRSSDAPIIPAALYVKGYLGGGILTKGDLNDEDFEPFIVPYSSTMSNHKDGQMLYGSVDLGYNLVRNHNIRVGAYAGYHYFQQQVSAYGCTQVATNPLVCGGAGVPYNIRVITQDNTYHSLRVGIDADIRLSDHWSLRLDAAYLPHVILHGADSHWLRIGTLHGDFAGPIREDGKGHGYALEAALNYAVNRNVSFALGGRYWHVRDQGRHAFRGQCRSALRRRRSRSSGKPIFTACSCRARSSSARMSQARRSELGCGGRIAGYDPRARSGS